MVEAWPTSVIHLAGNSIQIALRDVREVHAFWEAVTRMKHHQPGLRRVVARVWRREDDHGTARPPHAPLPHRGDGQRVDALPQEQRRRQEAGQGTGGQPPTDCRGGSRAILTRAINGIVIHSRGSKNPAPPLAQFPVGTVAQFCIGADNQCTFRIHCLMYLQACFYIYQCS